MKESDYLINLAKAKQDYPEYFAWLKSRYGVSQNGSPAKPPEVSVNGTEPNTDVEVVGFDEP